MLVAWLVIGIVAVAIELHHLAFFALFVAAGAFAAAAVALVAPSALPVQLVVAGAVTAVGVRAVRPRISQAFARRQEGHVPVGVHGGLVGQEVVTLDTVGDDHEPGHVRLLGEVWLAVSGSGESVPTGERVLVTAVRGTTLTVWPVNAPAPSPTFEIDDGRNQR